MLQKVAQRGLFAQIYNTHEVRINILFDFIIYCLILLSIVLICLIIIIPYRYGVTINVII